MVNRKLCGGVVLLVILALFLAGPATAAKREAAPAEVTQFGLFLASANGDVQTFSLDRLLSTAVAARECNGGSCQPPGGGSTLNCPTSGGPTCAGTDSCACICTKLSDGTYAAINTCIPAKKQEDVPKQD